MRYRESHVGIWEAKRQEGRSFGAGPLRVHGTFVDYRQTMAGCTSCGRSNGEPRGNRAPVFLVETLAGEYVTEYASWHEARAHVRRLGGGHRAIQILRDRNSPDWPAVVGCRNCG